tara:strand:+ start:194 stop:352 length:159 start_codon:yes stop_codon:yes gene_type:complete
MYTYTVEKKVTFHYKVEAKNKKEAIAIVEDMGETLASISSTDWKVKSVSWPK